jgi:uncharacterized metal-binding protein YceD (DUF177 family)
LPEEGAEFRLIPDEATRAALAKFVGVLAVPRLEVQFKVTPSADGGASIEGTLDATVTQECGVSLEPFDNKVSEKIALRFAPEGSALTTADIPEDEIDAEPPEQLENGALDLAAVAAEFLALGIDPYPRRPGAVFQSPDTGAKPSAFAALEQLKRSKDRENG